MTNKDFEILKEKLLARSYDDNGCKRWLGALNKKGYGQIHYQGKQYEVHRISAAIFLGLDLSNKRQQSNHKLECKNHDCWEPSHLYIGDFQSNANDTVKLRTHKETRKTHCSNGHEYNEENTRLSSKLGRRCRICDGIRSKAQWEAKKQLNVGAILEAKK